MELAIDCRDLKKTYPGRPPVEAVRGIDLKVEQGSCFGVLGPNGAGKTTTIEILEGLLPATSGEAKILGMDWGKDDSAIRHRIGISLQETEFTDRLTVAETLVMFRSFYDKGISVQDAMERVSLTEKKDSWYKKLSGGQKQRLAVATALVGDPELIFLDEPTTGLDPSSRRELWDIIKSFREQGRTILLTTHYMDEAEQLCDRVAIFDQGKVIAEDTPRALIASIGAEHVVEFSIDGEPGQLNLDNIRQFESVEEVERVEDRFRMTLGLPHVVLPKLIQTLAEAQINLTGLSTRHASLEDVFIGLTGRGLQDEMPEKEGENHA